MERNAGLPGHRPWVGRIGHERLDPQHVDHPAGADERPRDLVDRLPGGAQRNHEEGGVSVEGDEVARVDRPGEDEPRTDPGDDDDEDARQQHLGCVERRLRRRDANAGTPDALGALAVAIVERLLASDSAQDPEPGGGVGSERRQPADLLALRSLPRLERADHGAERDDEDRDPDQHREPQLDGAREEDHGDDDVRDDRPGEPRGDVERPAGAERVVRHRGDHLSGRVPAADRLPRPRGVVPDHLDEQERGAEPVLDGEAVPHDPGGALDESEAEEQGGPRHQRRAVVLDDPVLDGAADRVRHQRLGDHPRDPEGDPEHEGAHLLPPDPQEQLRGRAPVRDARLGDGEGAHAPGHAWGPPTRVGRGACRRCGAARAPRGRASRAPSRSTRRSCPRTTSSGSRPRRRGCASPPGRGTTDRA